MIPSFSEANLEQVSNYLGDTSTGLTGSEIERYLRDSEIEDVNPSMTKRIRLYEALAKKQRLDRCANNICSFIERVMSPVLYVNSEDYFTTKQKELNRILSFEGIRLNDEGKLEPIKKAKTISDAQEAADQLRRKLMNRGVHGDVLKFCKAELVQSNYFHAVLEASKSVSQKIRDKSGLDSDAGNLVDDAFGIGKKALPVLAFNSLETLQKSDSCFHEEPYALLSFQRKLVLVLQSVSPHSILNKRFAERLLYPQAVLLDNLCNAGFLFLHQ